MKFAESLKSKELTVTVEVHPPKGIQTSSIFRKLKMLSNRVKVHAFNATDTPLSQGRMSSLAMSILLQKELNIDTIFHIATRNKNLLAHHSDLIGAYSLGIRNVLVFMGDDPGIGDHPESISFSDITSSQLINLIKSDKAGINVFGKEREFSNDFYVGGFVNIHAEDMNLEFESVKRKIDAGVDYFYTQANYSTDALVNFFDKFSSFSFPLVMGVLPLKSFSHARFLNEKVPGINVPDKILNRMKLIPEIETSLGVIISQDLINSVKHLVSGVYMIPSFGRYDLIGDVLEGINY